WYLVLSTWPCPRATITCRVRTAKYQLPNTKYASSPHVNVGERNHCLARNRAPKRLRRSKNREQQGTVQLRANLSVVTPGNNGVILHASGSIHVGFDQERGVQVQIAIGIGGAFQTRWRVEDGRDIGVNVDRRLHKKADQRGESESRGCGAGRGRKHE